MIYKQIIVEKEEDNVKSTTLGKDTFQDHENSEK